MELLRAVAAFVERPTKAHASLAETLDLPEVPTDALWTQVFGFNLYPYASVYLGLEGKLGGEARDRVAGFFRALDAVPPPEPDHLPVLLAALAELHGRGVAGDQRAAHAAATLLHEHVLPWLPLYLGRMEALAPEPYRSWASLTADALRHVSSPAPEPIPPLHLREAPALEDPRGDDATPLLDQLLAPSRTGFVLTTTDLRRAGRETGLPLRIGERRYVLSALLGQSVPDTLRWLSDHASTTSRALHPWEELVPQVAGWWGDRARATAALLEELAEEASEATIVPVA